jgi:hypothetical protein
VEITLGDALATYLLTTIWQPPTLVANLWENRLVGAMAEQKTIVIFTALLTAINSRLAARVTAIITPENARGIVLSKTLQKQLER